MLRSSSAYILSKLKQQVTPIGLGALRILYGLVLFQEILFLLYFNHLIFDPIPYLDVEYPMISFFLGIWGVTGLCLIVGYRCQVSAIVNYVFWIVFVSFTPMQRDFDGGFDQFMTGLAFLLIFLPVERALSIDNLREKLADASARKMHKPSNNVSVLAYLVPVTICLGFLYLDSAIHKLSSEHWRNGLGGWLPSSLPYYISALDLSWLLNIEFLQKTIGYTIIAFQFAFLPLYFSKRFRPIALVLGILVHLGITIAFNIYPFGLGMLALYPLLIPFSWWRCCAARIKFKTASLTLYYDEECPLCNRTVIIINHFDAFSTIDFKGLQAYAATQPALQHIKHEQLLYGLCAVDAKQNCYTGLMAYIQILAKMRYLLPVSLVLRIPGIYHLCLLYYHKIADTRMRIPCDSRCVPALDADSVLPATLYQRIFEQYAKRYPRQLAMRLTKIFVFLVVLQLNSSLHYGVLYRLGFDSGDLMAVKPLTTISNSLLTLTTTFLGITPHALYLHDHFAGYNHLLGITYLNLSGQEVWLPFINVQGRIVAPNWGRVHSMWANIAVTPKINNFRLEKFLMKVTAFWGIKLGLDLDNTQFIIKLKKVEAPTEWVENLRFYNINQPWKDIGNVHWDGQKFNVSLPANIEAL